MFEDVGNPFGVLLIRFLPSDCFYVLGVGKNDIAGRFQDVVNGYPILSCRLHTHILAIMFRQPDSTPPQIIGESRKPLALVAGHTLSVCRGNTRHNKRFVDIYPAADWINDFEHNTLPQKSI